jgi:Cdc6-like AAA superfamily ATPase
VAAIIAAVVAVAGLGFQWQQNKLAEEQKKLAEEQKKLAEEQKKLAEQEAYERSEQKQLDVALEKLSEVFVPDDTSVQDSYISRPEAEQAIRNYLKDELQKNYLVVTAPKGSGKTTVIHHALAEGGRSGVLLVKVENQDTLPNIQKLVVQAMGVSSGDPVGGDRLGFIKKVCVLFTKKNGGRKPVIVINVEGDRTDPEAVGSLAKQLGHFQKAISSDTGSAFSIADISAISLASGMTYDPRAKFVNIPGLSAKQGEQLLEPYAQKLREKDTDVKDVVEQIGGNPAWLIRVAGDDHPQAVIDTVMSEAEREVNALLRAHPQYKGALQELALKEFGKGDKGVVAKDFDMLLDAGSSWWWSKRVSNEPKRVSNEPKRVMISNEPSDVISVSQKYRVVHKDLQNEHIVFHTYPHYLAAKQILKC